jgi:hypothetical protein
LSDCQEKAFYRSAFTLFIIGHVAEFGGIGRALLVTPGKRRIIIKLPGYQSFETDIDLVANQKSTLKTELVKIGASEEASQLE